MMATMRIMVVDAVSVLSSKQYERYKQPEKCFQRPQV